MKTRGIARCSRNRSPAGRLAPIAAALVMALAPAPAFPASSGYLRIPGLDGESQVRGRKGWLEIDSYQRLAYEKCSLHEK
jgi:hypothetical protein